MTGPLEEPAQKRGTWQELSEDSRRGRAPARTHGPPEPRACVCWERGGSSFRYVLNTYT